MPTANAISVAVGIPQPEAAGVPLLMKVKIRAGKRTPPKAAMTGIIAFLGELSSPHTISRLISRPTVKKKMTIRMSLMNFSRVMPTGNISESPSGVLSEMPRSISRTSKYRSRVAGKLASSMATTTQASRMTPWNQGRLNNFFRWVDRRATILFQEVNERAIVVGVFIRFQWRH